VDGQLVQRYASLWTTLFANRLLKDPALAPDRRAVLQSRINTDRIMFGEDVRHGKPDIILAEIDNQPGGTNWIAWAQENPDVARELSAFAIVATVGDIAIMARKK
jgi:hypothetical protein